jgi:hypothetical protein
MTPFSVKQLTSEPTPARIGKNQQKLKKMSTTFFAD